VVGVVGDELIGRIGTWFPIRVVRRYLALSGYDRALGLACQAFVALVPMLIVIAATLSERGRVVANGYVVDGLHLSGSAAADLQALVQRPPDASEPITLVGVALLVLSVFGFTRTLQRTCQAAWDLPTQGLRGFALGLLGAGPLHRPPQQNGQDQPDHVHAVPRIGGPGVLVSWLIVLGLLLVVGAVVSAEMAHDPPRLRRSVPVSPEPADEG
jgi:hypothetical protein